MTDPRFIRNFSIVAHIDHGKTTLSDRILQRCNAVTAREMHEQMLDDMDLEKERGHHDQGARGHAQVQGEGRPGVHPQPDRHARATSTSPTRSPARSPPAKGAVLVVDATQGVEAQTLANAYLATHHNLVIVPVINKIDLPSAEPEKAREQIEQVVGIPADDAVLTSAKMGIGIDELLERIVRDVPPPKGDPDAPLKALLFDSWYDPYRGVTSLVRIVDGKLEPRMRIRAMGTGLETDVEALGVFRPQPEDVPSLSVGEVGSLWGEHQGPPLDPHRRHDHRAPPPDGGAAAPASPRPSPWSSPASSRPTPTSTRTCATRWRSSRLNDASFSFEPENSTALGFGFRCGFLGLLHMEIIQERLEREFDLDLITTAPGVNYRVTTTKGEILEIVNPNHMPPPDRIERVEEPYITATIITRDDFLGGLLKLCEDRRGTQKSLEYLASNRVRPDLRVSAGRGRPRLLRQAQVDLEGLRLVRLRVLGLPGGRPRQARPAGQRRPGRRPVPDRPPGGGRRQGTVPGGKDEGNHPPPDVRGGDPGGDRLQDHRPGDRSRRSARTCSPSATAATSRESESSSKSRRRARSA